MPQHRQLSAILFTDIEGYTAIMQQNESTALMLKDRHRDILQKEHQRFNGRVVQYYGDGTLSTFQSIIEAVQCAVSMQLKFLQTPQVPVRMGLHIGDIVFNDEFIFGDGVNLASRIESLGVPGSILLSDKANDELHNHPELQTVSAGIYHLKNITRPVEVFAVSHKNLVTPAPNSLQGKTEQRTDQMEYFKAPQPGIAEKKKITEKSIAVLPFANMSNDPEQEYFSDGMAEEIINALTHLKDLKVAGRTSSFQFRGKNIDLRELGNKLSVKTVLEGSVRKQGNWIRVTAQLVDVDDGYHLWSEKYDRELNDVFAIQENIAVAITKKLKLTLLKKDRDRLTQTKTQNTEAYELYLKGRFYTARRGASVITGMQYFQKAIAIDPEFALAHAAYADAHLLIASYGLLPPKQILPQAKKSAERALALDPTLSEPYCSLGYYYACYEWNWPQAKRNFMKALEINPRYAEGHYRYGWTYLTCVEGKFDEAEKHGKIAIHLEPLSSICFANYSLILHCAGKFLESLSVCEMGLELDPNSFLCHLNAGITNIALKDYEKAKSSLEAARKLSSRDVFSIHGLIWTFCLTNRFDQARVLMNDLKDRSATEYVANTLKGLSAGYLNDVDEAFEYFEKAYDDRDPVLLMLKYEWWVPASIRTDLRFPQLLRRIGFPDTNLRE
jgi:TolB-like protein/class 3 adenylate cyclase/Tfp pilus assembly protein PilF